MKKMLIKNIGMLATPLGSAAKAGKDQGNIQILQNAFVLVEEETITRVGSMEELGGEGLTDLPEGMAEAEVVDAEGKLVTPGLVDAHTHLVFGGWRQHEMELKLKGVPYLEILAAGGGILSTVNATRTAGQKELLDKTLKVLDDMLHFGVTTCEAKSGYGLNCDDEIKQLRVIHEADQESPVDLAATFMGAHALPTEYKEDREAYIHMLCSEMIPRVATEGLAEFCDIFCEEGVFNAEESFDILDTAKAFGLIPKIHADEICDIGGTEVARDVRAISAEHLIKCSDKGIEALRDGGTIACLLPCTSLYLGANFAPARAMIEAGVPVAISTDFNPGSCPCSNIQLAMNLGCLKYKMTPEEVLTAVTLNGAAAIYRAESIGSVESGKQADLVIWDAPDLNYIFYRMGSNLAAKVIKRGKIYE